MQGIRRGVANRIVELRRCGEAGRAAGDRGVVSSWAAAACWRRNSRHLLRVANFAQAASRKEEESRRLLGLLSSSLRVADWVVLGHGTNVTRVTRWENII